MHQLREERSVGELFGQLTQDLSLLVRQEAQLAKTEVQEKISRASRDLVSLAAGGIVALIGGFALTAAVILLLVDPVGLEPWLAALLVGRAPRRGRIRHAPRRPARPQDTRSRSPPHGGEHQGRHSGGEGAAAMNEYERHLEGAPGNGNAEPQGRAPEIEREIEATRERMSQNIDELGERFSPDNLKRQAKDAITGQGPGHRQQRGRPGQGPGVPDAVVHSGEHLAGRGHGTRRGLADPAAQPERGVRRPDGAVRLHRPRAAARRLRRAGSPTARRPSASGLGPRHPA